MEVKCICGCEETKQSKGIYEETILVEYTQHCVNCGRAVWNWAYGTPTFMQEDEYAELHAKKVQEIKELAEVTNLSVSGEINRIAIHWDDYDFLVELIGEENKYADYSDDVIEMDYHSEFVPLIDQAQGSI